MKIHSLNIFRSKQESFLCQRIDQSKNLWPITLIFSNKDAMGGAISIHLKNEVQLIDFVDSVNNEFNQYKQLKEIFKDSKK